MTGKKLRFVDLFAGLGGFHLALSRLGLECVFASEINEELRSLYLKNFPCMSGPVVGDIREHWTAIPEHDVLAAGFPCQAFSKSGSQAGVNDPLRGTLYRDIIRIVKRYRPRLVILENVGNFERHQDGKAWNALESGIRSLGYTVHATNHKSSGGPGLFSPHDLGLQQKRQRFYVVCTRGFEARGIVRSSPNIATFDRVPLPMSSLSAIEKRDSALSRLQVHALELWSEQVARIRCSRVPLPTFPLWVDEFAATYPTGGRKLAYISKAELISHFPGMRNSTRSQIISSLPSYIRKATLPLPDWKIRQIQKSRNFYNDFVWLFPQSWLERVRALPSSYRKLEWNAGNTTVPFWDHTFQFRPSGIRVSNGNEYPTLVAMTPSQTPVVGSQKRFLTETEALLLQGFPSSWAVPAKRNNAMQAIGNAVHSAVVESIASTFIQQLQTQPADLAEFKNA